MNVLGCDDQEDAKRSLASIYQVDIAEINKLTKNDWPDFLRDSQTSYLDTFDSKYVPTLMASHLAASPNWNFGDVAYYHRTAYTGSAEWFQDGLLASTPAARAFLCKVGELVTIDNDHIALVVKNIVHRTLSEGQSEGGPYAFDVFDDAKYANRPGLDYSLPEFFMVSVWERKYGVPHARDLREKLQKILKPVVVKFSATPNNPDGYITNLWHYLFRGWNGDPMVGSNHYPCTFLGEGKSVPAERIIKIIDL